MSTATPDPQTLPKESALFHDLPLGHSLADRKDQPLAFRGLAAHWPAVQKWSLQHLLDIAPDMPVKLVAGNRERYDTRFVPSTLSHCLQTLH